MAWHAETLRLEVAVEFQRAAPSIWSRLEDALWNIRMREFGAWAEHAQWWRKTTKGKKYQSAYSKERNQRLKKRTAGVRTCIGCGARFSVSEYQARRGRDKVCSTACRGKSRTNIKRYELRGESLTLTEWSARSGVATTTIEKRLRLGWELQRAVFAPLRGKVA